MILYLGKRPVGIVRFECQGVQLIGMSVNYAERKLNVSQLCARTKQDNEASKKVLLLNGFRQIDIELEQDSSVFCRALTPRGV